MRSFQLWSGPALLGHVTLPPSVYHRDAMGRVTSIEHSMAPLQPAAAYAVLEPSLRELTQLNQAFDRGDESVLPAMRALHRVHDQLALHLTTLDGEPVAVRRLELTLRTRPGDAAHQPLVSCRLPDEDGPADNLAAV